MITDCFALDIVITEKRVISSEPHAQTHHRKKSTLKNKPRAIGEFPCPHHTPTISLKKQNQQIQTRFFNCFVGSTI